MYLHVNSIQLHVGCRQMKFNFTNYKLTQSPERALSRHLPVRPHIQHKVITFRQDMRSAEHSLSLQYSTHSCPAEDNKMTGWVGRRSTIKQTKILKSLLCSQYSSPFLLEPVLVYTNLLIYKMTLLVFCGTQ